MNGLEGVQVSKTKQRKDTSYTFLYNMADTKNIKIDNIVLKNTKDVLLPVFYNKKKNSITFTEYFTELNSQEQSKVLGNALLNGIVDNEIKNLSFLKQRKFKKEFNVFIKNILKNENLKNEKLIQQIIEDTKSKGLEYFISQAFTNDRFVALLNSEIIPGENKIKETFWNKLKNIILSIISDDKTLMDSMTDILDTYLEISSIPVIQNINIDKNLLKC